jgi:hypothetical protein
MIDSREKQCEVDPKGSQMNKTTAQASAAIDKALSFVEASNKRIGAMERKAA